jgi:hypothetical protein
MMPTRIKIDKPNPAPESNDTSFYKAWSLPHAETDIENVLNSWRKQQD